MNVLFVCTGNACRSALAEYLFRKMLEDEGLNRISVKSRGTGASGFILVPEEVKRILREDGIEDPRHRPTPLDAASVHWADLILTMTQGHAGEILRVYPEAQGKTRLLSSFAGHNGDPDIADPIGRREEDYRACAQTIRDCLAAVLEKLRSPKRSSL